MGRQDSWVHRALWACLGPHDGHCVQGAPRGGGSDHPLELPHPHGCMEAGACPSCWQLRCHEGTNACMVLHTAPCPRQPGIILGFLVN